MISRVLLLCCLLAGLAACTPLLPPSTAAQAPPLVCDTLDNMLRKLEKNARYAYTADAIDSRERVHMLFVNPKTRNWVQLHVYSNLNACIDMKGSDWHWAMDH
jgi:hypothetical protein